MSPHANVTLLQPTNPSILTHAALVRDFRYVLRLELLGRQGASVDALKETVKELHALMKRFDPAAEEAAGAPLQVLHASHTLIDFTAWFLLCAVNTTLRCIIFWLPIPWFMFTPTLVMLSQHATVGESKCISLQHSHGDHTHRFQSV